MTYTHTYVELELSKPAYDEIARKLRAAGYDHAFGDDGLIDMHGLAVGIEPAPEPEQYPEYDRPMGHGVVSGGSDE